MLSKSTVSQMTQKQFPCKTGIGLEPVDILKTLFVITDKLIDIVVRIIENINYRSVGVGT